MKVVDKRGAKKQKNKKKLLTKPKKEKVLVVAQEFKFAKLLSGNEKKSRDRVLKTLKKWLLNCFSKDYVFKEDDFIRVWKGLFYAVWMSDKPLVQEDLCESISQILDLFPKEQFDNAIMMTKVGFKVLAMEWYGIDQHRIDKFMMLVRRYLRGSFRCLLRTDWDLDSCKKYADMLSSEDGLLALKTPFYARNALSLILHIIDCYLEELSKISRGKISDESLLELIDPFLRHVCNGESQEVSLACRQLLTDLIKQSEPGLKYAGATQAWKRMGCPAGGPDALELVSDDENEDEQHQDQDESQLSSVLDPRAGHVDVVLEPLPVPSELVVERTKCLMKSCSCPKAYKRARACLERFEKLSRNDYPLKIKAEEVERSLPQSARRKAAAALRNLERNLVISADELALRGLRRKHKKRLLAKARAGLSIIEDVQTNAQKNLTNGDSQTDSTSEDKTEKTNKNKDKIANNKRKSQEPSKVVKKKAKVDDSKVAKLKSPSSLSQTKNKKSNKENEVKVNKLENGVVNKNVSKKGKTEEKVAPSKVKPEKIKKAEAAVNGNGIQPKVLDSKPSKKENVDKDVKIRVDKKEAIKAKQQKINDTKANRTDRKEAKVKNYQKQVDKKDMETPKKVKFVLKNNCMQGPVDYYKSVRQSPNIPYDSSKKPIKTNLKPSTPSPINPFFKKKLKLRG
ncbi:ribosomal RNA processing protein 1 homolog [Zerene cesonia]|uniref:ribosomal RNA processing protein 1 homolog n=1 Tax=Zerene cesonia TaxID=33412 RepID=UPI0018E55120|nr:ribosomal RNA processing protein 1 homolog [Zerene cesonia]